MTSKRYREPRSHRSIPRSNPPSTLLADRVNVTTMNRVMDNVHVVVPPKDFLPYENLGD